MNWIGICEDAILVLLLCPAIRVVGGPAFRGGVVM